MIITYLSAFRNASHFVGIALKYYKTCPKMKLDRIMRTKYMNQIGNWCMYFGFELLDVYQFVS